MTKDSAGIKICEWNIHHQGGGVGETTPEWAIAELKDQDIVVLTEFPTKVRGGSESSRSSVMAGLHDLGFACFPSGNQRGNDVLIAIQKSLITGSELEFRWSNPYCNEGKPIPENAFVKLKIGDRDLVVVGVRIRTLKDFKARKTQFDSLIEELKKLFPNRALLIAGDWNHGRANSENPDWSLTVMTNCLEKMNYSVSPKKGSSIFQENGYYDFPDDHFIVNQAMLCLEEVKYDRGFTKHDSITYRWGRDFCNRRTRESVQPPYPDHAMLKATLAFAD